MSLFASATPQRTPIPAGVYRARCFQLVDLGTQDTSFDGKARKRHEVLVSWEIVDERIDMERDGKTVSLPRVVSKRYTLSLDERATLRHHLDSWRGKPMTEDEATRFDLKAVLGAPAFLNVVHKPKKTGGVSAAVEGVMRLPKGTQEPVAESVTLAFDLDDCITAGGAIPTALPDWIVEAIKKSDEWRVGMGAGSQNAALAVEDFGDDGTDAVDDTPF